VPIILHCDADAFFAQCEALRQPDLMGRPLAVQQHQDIISVNYAARALGVAKHMLPAQARALLSPAGGVVVHVHLEDDLRTSYRPYREMSAALMRWVRAAGGVLLPARLQLLAMFLQR
jgi:nucleotidyltransferase/DNA polymerase involved in DNA repair